MYLIFRFVCQQKQSLNNYYICNTTTFVTLKVQLLSKPL